MKGKCVRYYIYNYAASDEVDSPKDNQEKRFSTGNTFAGTSANHKSVSVNENQVRVRRISTDNTSFIVNVNESYNNNSTKLVSLPHVMHIEGFVMFVKF